MTELTLFSSSQPLEKSLELAKVILDSKLAPADLKSPEAILVACTFGAELGFTPIQSMNLINVISGKPTLGSAAKNSPRLPAQLKFLDPERQLRASPFPKPTPTPKV
jgi:hypothetical protein